MIETEVALSILRVFDQTAIKAIKTEKSKVHLKTLRTFVERLRTHRALEEFTQDKRAEFRRTRAFHSVQERVCIVSPFLIVNRLIGCPTVVVYFDLCHVFVVLQPRWAYDLVDSGFYRGISIQHKLWYCCCRI